MEKLRTIGNRKYYLLSSHSFFTIKGDLEYEESIVLDVVNNGGDISFTFTDLSSNEVTSFVNPSSGNYVVPLQKGGKMKLDIRAKKAIGSYRLQKRTIKK